MNRTTRPSRLRRGAQVLAITAGMVASTGVSAAVRRLRRVPDAGGIWRPRVAALLIRLGPSYVKLGQLLSTRRDILPVSWCRALGELIHDMPPPPREDIAEMLGRSFPPDQWPFATFQWQPVANGSIATVHRATLPDGRDVAVKVRRLGVAETMAADFAVLTGIAAVLARLPVLRRLPIREMVRQVGDAMLGQLDFAAERASLSALAENFAGDSRVHIPEVVADLGTPDVIVMEFVSGLERFRPEGLDAQQRRDVVEHTLRAVYRMLFVDGLVHCDLHPGNLYLSAPTHLVVLDAGFVVALPAHVRRLFAAFFFNMAMGRGKRCADIVIESAAAVSARCDLDRFRADLATLVEQSHGARAKDFNLGLFAARLFSLQRRHGLYAAAEFVFPLLCLLVVEGMVKEFDAEIDFQAVALPIVLRALMSAEIGH